MPKRPEVDAWFRSYDNPMKATMLEVRRIVLAADRRMDECIKWQAPTFTYEGNLASFNPRSKKHASLLFHTGASIPGRHPHLQGGKGVARYMQFTDPADARAKKNALQAVVKAWIASRDGAGAAKAVRKATATSGRAASKMAKNKPAKAKAAGKNVAAAKKPVKKKPVKKKAPAAEKPVKKKAPSKKKTPARAPSKKKAPARRKKL